MSKESRPSICVARHLNHVCLAVKDIEQTMSFYNYILGISESEIVDLVDQGVRATLVRVGASQLELISPTDPDGGVARFIKKRGEGMHHIGFEVDNLEEKLQLLDASGIRLIDKTPRPGLSGMIAFVHPQATSGVLIELVEQATARR